MDKPILLALVALPATLGVLLAAPAAASTQSIQAGSAFGRHVSQCVQVVGFGTDHNPGMHRGFSGWDGMPC